MSPHRGQPHDHAFDTETLDEKAARLRPNEVGHERHTIEGITPEALDELYAERDRLRAELDRMYRRHDSADALQYALSTRFPEDPTHPFSHSQRLATGRAGGLHPDEPS
ncbi:hypothetical protein [Nonomuraea sp. NPDC001636]|uniref:hypothetical protein n=1 Tax=Actinomycetes TaxID=1760 RepID=UPI00332A1632